MRKIKLQVSADLVVNQLASGLYRHPGRRLIEIIRNGMVARMDTPEKWEPKKSVIKIWLVKDHPLAENGEPVLVIWNNGRGFTDKDFDGYFRSLGTPSSMLDNVVFSGASQKGMGRLAAAALNRLCIEGPRSSRIHNGYYLMTRATKTGDVRFVPMKVVDWTEGDGIDVDRTVKANSPKLKPFAGVDGHFTALVIPTPIFQTYAEIEEAVKWFLPREMDKMPQLYVGNKLIEPPALEDTVNCNSADGLYRARLGVSSESNDGVWLCDAVTGYRVASCRQLGGRYIPDPLWYDEMVGDIFATDFLRWQDTERGSLLQEFMDRKNPDWRRFQMFLGTDVVPRCKDLVQRDPISSTHAELLDEVASLFDERFGPPEKGPSNPRGPRKPGSGGSGGGGGEGGGDGDKDPFRKHLTIRLEGNPVYLYRGRSFDHYTLCLPSPDDPNVIYVNVRDNRYRGFPGSKALDREHLLMKIMEAYGRSRFPRDPVAADALANRLREEWRTRSLKRQ